MDQKSRLPKFGRWLDLYYCFVISFFILLFFHHLTIVLLNFDLFSSLRYLDCYLPGRFLIHGRVAGGSKFIALILCLYQIAGRVNFYMMKPNYEMYCIEFMLFNYNEVLMWEIRLANNANNYKIVAVNSLNNVEFDDYYNSIVGFKNEFSDVGSQKLILRPNRTVKSWKTLTDFSFLFIAVCLLAFIFILPFVFYLLTPIIMTRHGFELNYPNCVDWIKNQIEPLDYKDIYVFRGSRLENKSTVLTNSNSNPLFLPFIDFQPFSFYNVVRTCIDLLINLICWLDIFLTLSTQLYFILIALVDIVTYAHELRKSLKKLVLELEKARTAPRQNFNQDLNEATKRRYSSIGGNRWQTTACHLSEVTENQALILDYFLSINKYNVFISFMAAFSILFWLIYTASFCFCFMLPSTKGQQTNSTEFLVLFGLATFFVLLIIGSAAIVRTASRNIYTLAATAMVLDQNYLTTKRRWSSILKFFFPTPLFCFRLFKDSEISWLFCLKVTYR